jgi:hypothetical protein
MRMCGVFKAVYAVLENKVRIIEVITSIDFPMKNISEEID